MPGSQIGTEMGGKSGVDASAATSIDEQVVSSLEPHQQAGNAPLRQSKTPASNSRNRGLSRSVSIATRAVIALRRPIIWLPLTSPLIFLVASMMLREPPLSTLALGHSGVDMQPGAKPSAHLTPLWLDQVLQSAVTPHWLLDNTNPDEQLAVTVRCRGSWCQLMMAHNQAELEHWHQTTLPVTSAPALWRGALTDLVNTAAAE